MKTCRYRTLFLCERPPDRVVVVLQILKTVRHPCQVRAGPGGRTSAVAPFEASVTDVRDAISQVRTLYDQGRYQEALPFAKEVVRLVEREFGANHPTFAAHLNNLAALYVMQGRDIEAEPLFERALTIFENVLGPDHPEVAITLENYASLLRATNRADEAEKLQTRAAAIRAKQTE